jgi:threonine/homoserine/homoserine lactone efflux protein
MVTHLAAFLVVAVVLIVTPGPDTALTIRNTLVGGRRAGVRTALGVSSGQLTWALAASAGLAVVLRASQPLFLTLRFAGAAYLVWLGLRALGDAVRGRKDGHDARAASGHPFRQGLLCNLGNPKMVVFMTSLLPQFGRSFAGLLLLGLVFAALTVSWLMLYAAAVARARALFLRSRVRRALDALTGAVLVALGLRLAAQHS